MDNSLAEKRACQVGVRIGNARMGYCLSSILVRSFALPIVHGICISSGVSSRDNILCIGLIGPSSQTRAMGIGLGRTSAANKSMIILSDPGNARRGGLRGRSCISPGRRTLGIDKGQFICRISTCSLGVLHLGIASIRVRPRRGPILPRPVIRCSFRRNGTTSSTTLCRNRLRNKTKVIAVGSKGGTLCANSINGTK